MQRSSFLRAAAAWLLLATASVHAGTIRDDVPDSQYLSLASQPAFAPVGEFQWEVFGFGDTAGSFLASGTLINQQWVLTAAHVVSDISPANISTMTFALGNQTYHVLETHFNSNYDGYVGDGYDVGLVKLDSPVTNIAPATLYTGTDENRKITTIVGYGLTGTGLTGATQPAGTKRAGTNVVGLGSVLNNISWAGGGNDTMLVADFDQPQAGVTGDPTQNLAVPTALEYAASHGDSGGGWFIQKGGRQYLAGVTSFGIPYPDNSVEGMYGDLSGASRVSSYLSWISQYTTYSTVAPNIDGDANGDGKVDVLDLGILATNWQKSSVGWAGGDFNGDGVVDVLDLGILATNWQATAGSFTDAAVSVGLMVPEPATMAILGLAGLGLLRRRK